MVIIQDSKLSLKESAVKYLVLINGIVRVGTINVNSFSNPPKGFKWVESGINGRYYEYSVDRVLVKETDISKYTFERYGSVYINFNKVSFDGDVLKLLNVEFD